MAGYRVIFRCEPDSGIFPNLSIYIDLNAVGNLSPQAWFLYTGVGSSDTLDLKIFADVHNFSGTLEAWNFAEVKIVGGQ